LSLAILVPVLGRPRNVRPLLESVRESTPAPYRVLFLCDPDDYAEHAAIDAAGGWRVSPGGSYAQKINAGVALTDEPFVFFAADDVHPQCGWLEAALEAMVDGVEVVGVNDCIPRPDRPEHATHFLVSRSYCSEPLIDGSAGPLCAAYAHAYCDDEMIAVAKRRGVYAYCERARVRHDHPVLGPNVGGSRMDATYELGMSTFGTDRRTFRRRQRLWAP